MTHIRKRTHCTFKERGNVSSRVHQHALLKGDNTKEQRIYIDNKSYNVSDSLKQESLALRLTRHWRATQGKNVVKSRLTTKKTRELDIQHTCELIYP